MKTTIEEVGDKIIVTLDGELDTAAAVEVDHKMTPVYEGKQKEIVIDCTPPGIHRFQWLAHFTSHSEAGTSQPKPCSTEEPQRKQQKSFRTDRIRQHL